MQTMSSRVQMEIVFVNTIVAFGAITVVIIQMNSSVVSVLILLLLTLVCFFVNFRLMVIDLNFLKC